MELRSFVTILFLLLCVPRNGVSTFTVTLTKSPDKAVFGTNQFQLTCTYNVGASEEAISFIWQRKRAGEQTCTTIATFLPPPLAFKSYILDTALNSRVSLTDPTSENTNGLLTFIELQCNDEAEYRCEGTYTTSTGNLTVGDNLAVQVSKTADFSTITAIPFSPGSDLKEGDTVTFICYDDIGRDPQGTLHWYYFIDGQTVGTDVTSVASTPQSVYSLSTCSYKQISTLVLTMDKRYNRFVVRCTLEQFNTGQTGDGYRQTNPIPVNYKPTITSISQSQTLTCSGESNPAPSTQWVLSNGTVVQSSQLFLMDLSPTTDHNYTCQLQNNYGGVNHTDSRSVVLLSVGANNIDCNFEDGTPLCGWVQDKTDLFDWSITSRAPSNNPMSHGHYLSIDASAHQQNETANLIGQPFHMENNQRFCFTFWYHMYGRDMGTLRLYMGHSEIKVEDTILWERQTNGGDLWKEAHVDITPPGPVVLMFEAIVGPGPDGDVAIDDIKMRPGACAGTHSGIIVG